MPKWQKFSAKLSCNAWAPDCAGVYAFFLGSTLLYIGMSGNIRLRMRSHRIENIAGAMLYDGYVRTPWGDFPWDSGRFRAMYRECRDYNSALSLEKKLIRRLSPRFNIVGNKHG